MATTWGRLRGMRSHLSVPLAVLVGLGLSAGCEDRGSVGLVGDDSDGSVEDTDEDTADSEACVGEVDTVLPTDGADDVSPGTVVRVDFLDAPVQSDVQVRLRADNAELPGAVTWSADGLTATFTPLQPVPSDTAHQLRVVTACGESVTTFTTGAPTWRMGFGATTQIKPERGPDLGTAFGTFLLRLDAASDTSLELIVAPAKGGDQDPCGITSDGRATRDDDGDVEMNFGLAEIVVDGGPVQVGDLRLTAALDAGTERLGDVTMAARVPVGALESALGRNSGTLCGPGNNQVPCLPCPGAIGGTCVRVELSDITGGASSATIEPQDAGDLPGSCGR